MAALSPRAVNLNEKFYGGFHSLIWVGTIIVATLMMTKELTKRTNVVLVLTGVMMICGLKDSGDGWWQKRDVARDQIVNYSRQTEAGEAISTIYKEGESLLVSPDEMLIHWQSRAEMWQGLPFYYAWMSNVPEIQSKVAVEMGRQPPTYFYYEESGTGLDKYLEQYRRLNKWGQESDLYILRKKAKELSSEERERLGYWGYTI